MDRLLVLCSLAAVCALSAALPEPVLAGGSGIYGRAAWRGELVPGVVVAAYADGSTAYLEGETARSDPTGVDGTYRLPLPPGRYTLVARKYGVAGSGRPGAGDYYCFYSGSPVVVPPDGWVPVGFNLVRFGDEDRQASERTLIEGRITYRDDPLERLYLYIYREPSEGFRGPGIATLPVGSGGRFRAAVEPGSYYLIARKRARGGMYGPMEIGDYFNYYPGNPVVVGDGERVEVTLETVTRISQLEEEQPVPGLDGRIVDDSGEPVPGVRVFAYPPGEVKGRPLFFSEPSDGDGRFHLPFPEPGSYSLAARQRFGGPAVTGEYHGLYRDGEPTEMGGGGPGGEVTLVVRREP